MKLFGKEISGRIILLGLISLVFGLIIGVLIGHYGINFNDHTRLSTLTAEEDESMTQKMFTEVKGSNIRDYLRNLTSIPHLAGTPADFKQAKELAEFWKENGWDHVSIVPYEVLLSFPQEENPNHIVLKDSDGDELFKTQLAEKVLSEDQRKPDVVPPFNAFSAKGTPEGDLVYVNYGRVEDFEELKNNQNIDLTDKICISRYGKIFRGDKVRHAEREGCAGVILYSDPADYAISGTDSVFPDTVYLPGTGVQRGNVKISSGSIGDPETPGYPSIESAYRQDGNPDCLPNIPAHPIGYADANVLLSNMTGDEVPETWKGALSLTYRFGPSMRDNKKVQMKISTENERRKTYNVVAVMKGSVEPDRYVMLGNHRDAWVFGAADPSSGTAVLMEMSMVLGKMYNDGWRPRRSIVLCSWGAEEPGVIGSREWVENFGNILGDRTVTYLNVDSALTGNYTFRAKVLPMIKDAVIKASQKVPNPDEAEEKAGRKTVYDTWLHRTPAKDSDGKLTGEPRVTILGSGSDFEPFVTKVGVTCGDFKYIYDRQTGLSSYPLYHSVYETFDLIDKLMDPEYKFSTAVTQFLLELTRKMVDSYVLPFDVEAYGVALNGYLRNIRTSFEDQMRANGAGTYLDHIESAISIFKEKARAFNERLLTVDKKNPMLVRLYNDQMMLLERAFIDPLGLPDRPYVRNVIFAPSAKNSYAGSSFPGITDTMYGIEDLAPEEKVKRWEQVKKQMSIVAFFIGSAADVLRDPEQFSQ